MSRAGEGLTEWGCLPGPRLSRSSSLHKIEKPFGDCQLSPVVVEESQEDDTCRLPCSAVVVGGKSEGLFSKAQPCRGTDTEDKTTTACLSLSSPSASPNCSSTGDRTSSSSSLDRGDDCSREVHRFPSGAGGNFADRSGSGFTPTTSGRNVDSAQLTLSLDNGGSPGVRTLEEHCPSISRASDTFALLLPRVDVSSRQASSSAATTPAVVEARQEDRTLKSPVRTPPPQSLHARPVQPSPSSSSVPVFVAQIQRSLPRSPEGGHSTLEERNAVTAGPEPRPSSPTPSLPTAQVSVGNRHVSAPAADGGSHASRDFARTLQSSSDRRPGQRFAPIAFSRGGSCGSSPIDDRSVPSASPTAQSVASPSSSSVGSEDPAGHLGRLRGGSSNAAHASYLERFYMQQRRLAAHELKRREEARREMATWHGADRSKEFQWHQRLRESSADTSTSSQTGLRLIGQAAGGSSEGRRSRSDDVRQQKVRGEAQSLAAEAQEKEEPIGAHASQPAEAGDGKSGQMQTVACHHGVPSSHTRGSGYFSSVKPRCNESRGMEEKMRDEERSSRLVKHLISLFQAPRHPALGSPAGDSQGEVHTGGRRRLVGDTLTQQQKRVVSRGLISTLPTRRPTVSSTVRSEEQPRNPEVFMQAVPKRVDQKTALVRSMTSDVARCRMPSSSPLLRNAPRPPYVSSSASCSISVTPRGSISSLPPSFTVPASPGFDAGRRCGDVMPPPGFSRDEVLVIQDALRRYSARGGQARQGGLSGGHGSPCFLQASNACGSSDLGRTRVHGNSRLPQKHMVVQSPLDRSQVGTPDFSQGPFGLQGLTNSSTPDRTPRAVVPSACGRSVSTYPLMMPGAFQQSQPMNLQASGRGAQQREGGAAPCPHTRGVGTLATPRRGVWEHQKGSLPALGGEQERGEPLDLSGKGGSAPGSQRSPDAQSEMQRLSTTARTSPVQTPVHVCLPAAKTSVGGASRRLAESVKESNGAPPMASCRSAPPVEQREASELISKDLSALSEGGAPPSNGEEGTRSQQACLEARADPGRLEVRDVCTEDHALQVVVTDRVEESLGEAPREATLEEGQEHADTSSTGKSVRQVVCSDESDGDMGLREDQPSDSDGDQVGKDPVVSGICTVEELDGEQGDKEQDRTEGVLGETTPKLVETSVYTRSVASLPTEKEDGPEPVELAGRETSQAEERDSAEDSNSQECPAMVGEDEMPQGESAGLSVTSVAVCSPRAQAAELRDCRTEEAPVADDEQPGSSPLSSNASPPSAWRSPEEEGKAAEAEEEGACLGRATIEDALLQLADCFAAATAATSSSNVQTREVEGRREDGGEWEAVGEGFVSDKDGEPSEEDRNPLSKGGQCAEGNAETDSGRGRGTGDEEHQEEEEEPLKPYEQIMLKFLRYRDCWESQGDEDEEAATRALDDVLSVLDQVSRNTNDSTATHKAARAEDEEAKLLEIDALLDSIPDFTRSSNLFSGYGGYNSHASDSAAEAGLFNFPRLHREDEELLFGDDLDGAESVNLSSPGGLSSRGVSAEIDSARGQEAQRDTRGLQDQDTSTEKEAEVGGGRDETAEDTARSGYEKAESMGENSFARDVVGSSMDTRRTVSDNGVGMGVSASDILRAQYLVGPLRFSHAMAGGGGSGSQTGLDRRRSDDLNTVTNI